MKCYLSSCFAGFIALDENCNLLDYELFPRSKIVDRILQIQQGNITREEKSILKRIAKKCEYIIIETNLPHSTYINLNYSLKYKFETPNKGGEYLRSNQAGILEKTGLIESEEDMKALIHDTSLKITRNKLKQAWETEDMVLIQAINAIDDLDESIGKLVDRLREWYSIHFPELDKIKSHNLYVGLVAEQGKRDIIADSGSLDEDLDIKNDMGAELEDSDILILMEFADSIRSLQKTKKYLIKYVDDKMMELAPNLQDLTGSSLGAKMIAHAGSIKKLAMFPSSTVQVIGAEKALFRHLKTGERPPKHGLIYQHPEVRGSNWWIRGKIARALASKISLAVRKDFFSQKHDPALKEDLQKKIGKIKKAQPFPKKSGKTKSAKGRKKKIKKKKKDKYTKKFDLYY